MRVAAKAALAVLALGVVGAITIPNLLSAKVNWFDTGAIAFLRTLARVQEEFAKRRLVDLDRDGAGEFGTLGELCGAAGLRTDGEGRGRGEPLDPPLLSPSLSNLDERGIATRSGYCFRVLLPAAGGLPSREALPGGPLSAPVDTDAAERRWVAYAWPRANWGGGKLTGESRRHTRAFFADGTGRLWFTWNMEFRYAGPGGGPSWDAAMPEDGWGAEWVDPPPDVEEYRGRDGNIWRDLETLYRR